MKQHKCLLFIQTMIFLGIMGLPSCQQTKIWKHAKTIDLQDVAPIGVTFFDTKIWLADGDNNRVVSIDESGKKQQVYTDFERPMHLTSDDNNLYIPEYGSDKIVKITNGQKNTIILTDSLDAPAGVAVFKDEMAIADFYHHRILYFDGKKWTSFGKEGKKQSEFYYPTDVHITNDYIYIADAYNNRVQIWDKELKFIQAIGSTEKMNAATGIYVTNEQLFVTDFENNRVLIYSLNGELHQIIDEYLSKPTDILVVDGKMYVTNYKGKNLQVFQP